eukprot:TRINITY_DN75793_c0_g1_i1.p1 TRINITY_DN75793_c0_g1~~TRINITY_DN75793_c0_g1_i1.p1  ORF type:complete len:205 (-),score=9.56 TRINITY_DN75793_c0_g1_i1:170-697(-)
MEQLHVYRYETLKLGSFLDIGHTIRVRAFPLSHGGVTSTAFLFTRGANKDSALLYLGDTGPDDVEMVQRNVGLRALFEALRKLSVRVAVIFLECSYDNLRPDDKLFGHLTPRRLATALSDLEGREQTTLVVTHVKPQWELANDWHKRIEAQVRNETKHLGLRDVIFPVQGKIYNF